MEKKQYARIKKLATEERFNDVAYANQLISTLCEELETKEGKIDSLLFQVKQRPVAFPQNCYLLFSRVNKDDFYLFRTKQEAELFRLSCYNKEHFSIRTIELFENHKKALFRKEYNFLKKTFA